MNSAFFYIIVAHMTHDGLDRLTAVNYGEGWNLTAYHTKYEKSKGSQHYGNIPCHASRSKWPGFVS